MIDRYCWTTPNGHKVTMFHAVARKFTTQPTVTGEASKILFGQTAQGAR